RPASRKTFQSPHSIASSSTSRSLTPMPIAATTQGLKRPIAALAQGFHQHRARLGAMLIGADIVHIKDVDPRQAEALKTVLERAHDSVIRIVVDRFEGQWVSPAIGEDAGRAAAQQPADLGRQHPFAPRTVAQRIADATLGLADPVVRRATHAAHAAGPGGAHYSPRGGADDGDLAAAKGGAAETELGDPQACA